MIMRDGQWTFGKTPDGKWNNSVFNTREEAIDAAKEFYANENLEEIYVGMIDVLEPSTFFDAKDMFVIIDKYYAEDVPEYKNDLFKNITEEQEQWFEERVAKLLDEFYKYANVHSNYYVLTEMEMIELV